MQTFTVVLINEFGTTIIHVPSVATMKIEPYDANVFVLLIWIVAWP